MQEGTDSDYESFYNAVQAPSKVEFPSLAHFIEDVVHTGLQTVRMDTFDVMTGSELSFVQYVTRTVFVTAFDANENTLYEYSLEIRTEATTAEEPVLGHEADEELERHISDIGNHLLHANLSIRHGRYTFPDRSV